MIKLACTVILIICLGFFPGNTASESNGTDMMLTPQELNLATQLWEMKHPWEEWLSPSPIAIALMGQLLVLSAKTDFPLNDRPPIGGFLYIRYPSSFRASLVQVATEAWDTFHDAYRTMDFMQLQMQQVPVHIKTAVRILKTTPKSIVKNMIRIPLQKIRDNGALCVTRAKATDAKFGGIMNLTKEILMALENGRGHYEQELRINQIDLAQANALKTGAEREVQDLETKQREMDEKVRQSDEDYRRAMNDIPTGWKAVFQDSFGKIVNIFTGGRDDDREQTFPAFSDLPQQPTASEDVEVSQTLDVIGTLKQEIKTLTSSNETNSIRHRIRGVSASLNAILKNLDTGNIGIQLGTILRSGIALCNQIAEGVDTENAAISAWVQEADRLDTEIKRLYAKVTARQDDPSSAAKSMGTFTVSGRHGNARFKAHLAMMKAQQAMRHQMQIYQMRVNAMKKWYNLLARLAKLDMEKINFEELIVLIKEAVEILNDIRTHWATVILFFSNIAERADTVQANTFSNYVQLMEANNLVTVNERQFALETTMAEANSMLSGAYYLYTLSSTYVEVHLKHINVQLAGLSRLTTLRPEQQTAELLQLKVQGKSAADDIKDMVLNKKEAYEVTLRDRLNGARAELQRLASLPDNGVI